MAQEAITNVVRHASATNCRVAATVSDHHLVLEVQDDGRGGAHMNGGIGLRSMRDRADEIGGTVDRVRRRGTRVTLSLPRELHS